MLAVSWSTLFEPGFFSSEPVQVALVVGAIAAVVSGIIGVFTVIRGQSFAGHALSDIGTAGGSAAVLVGASTLYGFVAFNVVAAAVMELIGIRKPRGRDLATGIVLGASLGLAALFLYEDTISSSTTGATVNVLFGSIFTLPPGITTVMAVLGVASVALIAVLYRPLLLSSLSYELAAARRVPVRLVGGGYLLALALAVSMSAVTIGAILSTALLIGPAAIALRMATRTGVAIAVAAAVGVFACWAGTLDRLRQHRLGRRERLAGQFLHRGRHLRPLLRVRSGLSSPTGSATGNDRRSADGGAAGRGGLMFANFMINAWEAATIVAIVAGVVGFFTVLRGAAFAAHSLPNGAFAGAAGAFLIGANTIVGLGVFSLAGAGMIAGLGRRARSDVATALTIVLDAGSRRPVPVAYQRVRPRDLCPALR